MTPEQPPSRPNVVYIITHDQGVAARAFAGAGPDSLSAVPTPNIDAIARRGTFMTNHFATAPLCTPARGSLITSRYPHENGLVGLTHRGFSFNPDEKTIFQRLHEDAGYHTVLVGLQHESEDPDLLGYQELHATQMITKCMWLIDDLEEVVDALQGREGPWWLSIGTTDIHREWTHRADPVDPATIEVPPYMPDIPEIRQEMAEFYGDLVAFDEFVGVVLELLADRGILDDTLVILTTDHGAALLRAKGTLYDPGIHTGIVWAWPGVIKENARVPALVSGVDFAPTLFDLLDLPVPADFSGRSYADLLRVEATETDAPPREERIFAEKTYHDVYDPIRCVRTPRYKYIRNYDDSPLAEVIPADIQHGTAFDAWVKATPSSQDSRPPEEFYDLVADPLEQENLALRDPPPPELAQYRQILTEWQARTHDRITEGPYPAPENARVDNAAKFPHLKGRENLY